MNNNTSPSAIWDSKTTEQKIEWLAGFMGYELDSDEPLSECCRASILPASEVCAGCKRKLTYREVRSAEAMMGFPKGWLE